MKSLWQAKPFLVFRMILPNYTWKLIRDSCCKQRPNEGISIGTTWYEERAIISERDMSDVLIVTCNDVQKLATARLIDEQLFGYSQYDESTARWCCKSLPTNMKCDWQNFIYIRTQSNFVGTLNIYSLWERSNINYHG